MRVIIAGGRDFDDYELLKQKCDSIFSKGKPIEIISGTAKGADSLGESYALSNNIPIMRFHPDWGTYGKSAGMIRNLEMAQYATHLIAFWDGKSRGTKNMIEIANEFNLPTRIVKY